MCWWAAFIAAVKYVCVGGKREEKGVCGGV